MRQSLRLPQSGRRRLTPCSPSPTRTTQQQQRCFWEIRDKFAQLNDATRPHEVGYSATAMTHWFPLPCSMAPAGLTNLSEAETGVAAEQGRSTCGPKITEAKGKVTRALAELERGYRAAPALVAQCAGLDKAIAARPLPSKPELPTLAAPKGDTPPKADTPKVTPPKAGGPNWPNSNSSSPATAGKPNWA